MFTKASANTTVVISTCRHNSESRNKVYYPRAPFPFEGTIDRVVFDMQ